MVKPPGKLLSQKETCSLVKETEITEEAEEGWLAPGTPFRGREKETPSPIPLAISLKKKKESSYKRKQFRFVIHMKNGLNKFMELLPGLDNIPLVIVS